MHNPFALSLSASVSCLLSHEHMKTFFLPAVLHKIVIGVGIAMNITSIVSLVKTFFWQAPIYVNKQIVMTDAIKISFATGRVRDSKSTYDVSLDR